MSDFQKIDGGFQYFGDDVIKHKTGMLLLKTGQIIPDDEIPHLLDRIRQEKRERLLSVLLGEYPYYTI